MIALSSSPDVRVKRRIFAGFVLLLFGFGLFCSFHLLRAAFVLYTYSGRPAPVPVRLYVALFAHPIEDREFTLSGTAAPISMRVFRPTDRKDPEPLVLVHGFTAMGNRDEHLVYLASCLARAGFLVVVPTLPAETESHMRLGDVLVIQDAVRWTAKETRQRVAVFGISFGGGLAVPAIAAPSVRDDVKMIFIFSAYNDLQRIGRYYMNEETLDPQGRAYGGHGPDIGRVLVFSEYLKEMIPAADVPALGAATVRMSKTPTELVPMTDPALRALTREQQVLLEDFEKVRTPAMHERYREVLRHHREEFAAMSPSSVLTGMRIPFWAISSTDDPTFPAGETRWTEAQLAGDRDAHILINPWINHGFTGRKAPLRDKLMVGIFFSRILQSAGSRSPLP